MNKMRKSSVHNQASAHLFLLLLTQNYSTVVHWQFYSTQKVDLVFCVTDKIFTVPQTNIHAVW